MQEERIDAAFQGLRQNMPRAPEALVSNMVRTVNALEAGRSKKLEGRSDSVRRQAVRDRAPIDRKPPELKGPMGLR